MIISLFHCEETPCLLKQRANRLEFDWNHPRVSALFCKVSKEYVEIFKSCSVIMANCSEVYCHNNKKKNKDKTFFTSPRDAALAKIWIAKLNREKDNLPKNVWICSDHFEDDCFDSSWMLQSSLTYQKRPIQLRLRSGAVTTKFPHKQTKVKERNTSKKREENRRHKEVCSVFKFQKSYIEDNLCPQL